MSTESIVNHHLTSFGEGNVDEMLKDYTDDAVVVGPNETLRDHAAIRALFSGWFETLFRPGTYALTLDKLEIEGEFAYFVWRAECEGADVTLGTDTMVVKNGKIVYQTFAAKIDPK